MTSWIIDEVVNLDLKSILSNIKFSYDEIVIFPPDIEFENIKLTKIGRLLYA